MMARTAHERYFPVFMPGVLDIYSLIDVAVILNGKMSTPKMGTGYATYSRLLTYGSDSGLCFQSWALRSDFLGSDLDTDGLYL